MPQDTIPNPMIKRKVEAFYTDSSKKKHTHTITFGLDTSKFMRMHNLYFDIRNQKGEVVSHVGVLSPFQIQEIQNLLEKEEGNIFVHKFDSKQYTFQKKVLSRALHELEEEKRKSAGMGFFFSFSLSVGF